MGSTAYRTRQRELIWNYLQEQGGRHVAAEEIADHLRAQGAPVGRSTVYRTLDRLVSEGLVRRFFLEEGMGACYQYAGDGGACGEHMHLKCVRCGRLYHIECADLCALQAHIKERHRFRVDNTKTVLYGVCASCPDDGGTGGGALLRGQAGKPHTAGQGGRE